MKIRALLASVGAVLALGLASPAWALYVLSVDAPSTGLQGTTVTVKVNLSMDNLDINGDPLLDIFGDPAIEAVDTIHFSLIYDPLVISFLSGSLGSLNATWGTFNYAAPSPYGSVNVSTTDDNFVGVFAPESGSVAELTFSLIGAGSSALTLSNVGLDNLDNFFLTNGQGPLFDADMTTSASITVEASNKIPNPASLLLVGLGLALLGWTRRNAG